MGSFTRDYYGKVGRGHQDVRTTFTGAATTTDVVAGDSALEYKVDRIIVAGGASAVGVHLEDGGTEKGPTLKCPANDTVAVTVLVDFDAGAGIDVQATAACDVYLDYHEKNAGE